MLIDVLTEEGVTGSSYLFAYTPLALAPLARLVEEIGGEISGKSIVPFERMREFNRRFRLLGWQGLVGMAVAGLDMAFWDALGKAAGWPVVRLLGGEPRPLMAYDSFGVLDPKTDASVLARSLEAGFRGIKIKLGDGDVEKDVATVAEVRKLIGAKVALMVDYNQSLRPAEACRTESRAWPSTTSIGSKSPFPRRTWKAMPVCAWSRRCESKRARTGGSLAIWPSR